VRRNIRVITVDDSAFARYAITRQLQSDPDIEVTDFARDGAEALEKIQMLKPDVVTLDVEMPRMDGITALERIMSVCPTPVVMLSSLTGKGTEATIRALERGAVDFFLKPSLAIPAGGHEEANDLIAKIKLAAKVNLSRLNGGFSVKESVPRRVDRQTGELISPNNIVVIGSSTGGPRALYQVIPLLPAQIPAAVLVIQHMPPNFTRTLAERLNQLSQIEVKEAAEGDVLKRGQALIAPGGYHTQINKNGMIELNQNPPIMGIRPSVDVAMESVAPVFGASSVAVVLTGMGSDGTKGTSFIKAVGGKVVAEDESTCAVYGMPRSVVEAGNADRVVPLPQVAAEIMSILNGGGAL
jgi:two-component system, chemotaxis family, protein-glutamate methylesterase/glutaminase